jgi:hypothetical protein
VGKGLRKERAQKRMNRVKDVAQWLGTCPNMCHVQGHGLCPCTRKQNNRKNGQILGTKSTDALLSTFAARQRRWYGWEDVFRVRRKKQQHEKGKI